MENTLVIPNYDNKTMRSILDNLVIWDAMEKQHHKNVIRYTEEKHVMLKGTIYIYTITALRDTPLVFYTIGEEVERRINATVRANGPQK